MAQPAASPLSALTDSTGPDYSKVVDQNIWEPLQSQTQNSASLPNLTAQMQSMPQMLSPHPVQTTPVNAPSPMRHLQQAAPAGGGGTAGPAYQGNEKGVALLRDAAAKAGFTGDALNLAVAIGMAESGGNPGATNSAGNSAGVDRGLWQINDYYHRDLYSGGFNWQDPYANARAAFQISGGGKNWHPWSTYNSGAYRRYMGG